MLLQGQQVLVMQVSTNWHWKDWLIWLSGGDRGTWVSGGKLLVIWLETASA